MSSAMIPGFSVITVCRNAASTIRRTLESVARQGGADWEHVVIDGGSTDGTLDLVDKYGKNVVLVSEPDQGIYDAMNKGIRLSSKELILMLNADDYLFCPGVLKQVASIYKRACRMHPEVVIFGDWIEWYQDVDVGVTVSGHTDFKRGMTLCHQAMYVPRELYERYGGYDTRWRLAADLDLAIRLKLAGVEFERFSRPLAVFSKSGASDRQFMRSYGEASEVIGGHYGRQGRVEFSRIFRRSRCLRGVRAAAERLLGPAAGRLLTKAWTKRFPQADPVEFKWLDC